jgi:hypothetical protein
MMILFNGKMASTVMKILEKTDELGCPQMPTGRFLVNDFQTKYNANGDLVELLIWYAG